MNRLRTFCRILSVMVVALFIIDSSVAQSVQGSSGNWVYSSKYSTDASGITEFIVSDLRANVHVSGVASNQIIIEEILNLTSKTEAQAKEDGSNAGMTVQKGGNVLTVRSMGAREALRDASYQITIPASIKVSLDVSSGNLEVSGMNAGIRVDTGAGNVTMSDVVGPSDIRSGAGNINLRDVRSGVTVNTGSGNIDAKTLGSDVYVSTGGGNVEVEDVSGEVKIVTAGGEVTLVGAKGNAELFTSGGNITVQDVLGSLDASTAGGTIAVSDVKGATHARTYGGDITARKMASSVRAETSAGNVNMTGLQGSFQVVSEVGNVTIQVDEGALKALNDASVEARYGNVSLSIPFNFNGNVSANISESGTIVFRNPGPGVETIRESPSTRREEMHRAEYRIGSGGRSITLSTRSGRIEISQFGSR